MKNLRANDHWLAAYREEHRKAFLQEGLPTAKNELWKYTDLSFLDDCRAERSSCHPERSEGSVAIEKDPSSQETLLRMTECRELIEQHHLQDAALIVMVDGRFSKPLSRLENLFSGIIISSLKDALNAHEDVIKYHGRTYFSAKKSPFAALNSALFDDGIFIYAFEKSHQPIQILSIVTGEEMQMMHPKNIIFVDKNSELTVYEECISLQPKRVLNTVTTITLDDKSRLNYCKLQHDATHFHHTEIYQHAESELKLGSYLLGTTFAREDIFVHLKGKRARCQLNGLYRTTKDDDYLDHHIDIHHDAPMTESSMLFKGIADKKARAVFNGRVFVADHAHKVAAFQGNHNLLLSPHAEVYAKPELEIYAQEVKCKHASTTGQVDQSALYYLRSRGISLRKAKQLLLQGFLQEVIQSVDHDVIKTRLQEGVSCEIET